MSGATKVKSTCYILVDDVVRKVSGKEVAGIVQAAFGHDSIDYPVPEYWRSRDEQGGFVALVTIPLVEVDGRPRFIGRISAARIPLRVDGSIVNQPLSDEYSDLDAFDLSLAQTRVLAAVITDETGISMDVLAMLEFYLYNSAPFGWGTYQYAVYFGISVRKMNGYELQGLSGRAGGAVVFDLVRGTVHDSRSAIRGVVRGLDREGPGLYSLVDIFENAHLDTVLSGEIALSMRRFLQARYWAIKSQWIEDWGERPVPSDFVREMYRYTKPTHAESHSYRLTVAENFLIDNEEDLLEAHLIENGRIDELLLEYLAVTRYHLPADREGDDIELDRFDVREVVSACQLRSLRAPRGNESSAV